MRCFSGCFRSSSEVAPLQSSSLTDISNGTTKSRPYYPPIQSWSNQDLLDWLTEPEINLQNLCSVCKTEAVDGSKLITVESEEHLKLLVKIDEKQILLKLLQLIEALKKPPQPPPDPFPAELEVDEKQVPVSTNVATEEKPKARELKRQPTVYWNANGAAKPPRAMAAWGILRTALQAQPTFTQLPDARTLMHILDTGIKGEYVWYQVIVNGLMAGKVPKDSVKPIDHYTNSAESKRQFIEAVSPRAAANNLAISTSKPLLPPRTQSALKTNSTQASQNPTMTGDDSFKAQVQQRINANSLPGTIDAEQPGAVLQPKPAAPNPNKSVPLAAANKTLTTTTTITSSPAPAAAAAAPRKASLVNFCPFCGASNQMKGLFCASCGGALAADPIANNPPPAKAIVAAPPQSISKHATTGSISKPIPSSSITVSSAAKKKPLK